MSKDILPPSFVKEAAALIREAGRIMLDARRSGRDGEDALGIREKDDQQTHVNFVTEYDSRVQAFLTEELSRLLPEAGFLAEEDDTSTGDTEKGFCFVIDPIDGTCNFIHDYRRSAISVGLLYNGAPIFGAILDPYLDELFTAEKGYGAYVNGQAIRVSDRTLDRSVIGIGTSPYYKEKFGDFTVNLFRSLLYQASDIRRSGSAAIDFASVASGRIDGFVEALLSPWDYCAGSLLVTEAGGIVTQMDGSPIRFDRPVSILTGNPYNYDALKVFAENGGV